jgi:glycosyltransferase involved in cell wall biosynthesis
LYQPERYLGKSYSLARPILHALTPHLRNWDRRVAASADRYLTHSTAVRDQIRLLYGIVADVLPAPFTLGVREGVPVAGIEPGFFLCVSRLLPYKNIDGIISAFAQLPKHRLVLAGTGPEEKRLRREAPRNVRVLGLVSDEELRWLYANSATLIAASFEDYGLTPLEAAAHGKPTAALRWGGYLDTVIEGETGIFFDSPTVAAIREAIERVASHPFTPTAIRVHASRYSEGAFIKRLRAIVLGGDQPERRTLAEAS